VQHKTKEQEHCPWKVGRGVDVSAAARTADIALEKQCYKPPDLENNPLPQGTDWQSMFR